MRTEETELTLAELNAIVDEVLADLAAPLNFADPTRTFTDGLREGFDAAELEARANIKLTNWM